MIARFRLCHGNLSLLDGLRRIEEGLERLLERFALRGIDEREVLQGMFAREYVPETISTNMSPQL